MSYIGGSRIIWLGLIITLIVAGVPLSAGTIDIFSNPNSGSNSITGTNVGILTSPAWAPAPPGAEWISYGATGCNVFVPLTGVCTPGPQNPVGTTIATPTATFYQTFTVTDQFATGTLFVWADDTAAVWLDNGTVSTGDGSAGGESLFAANPNLGGNCADAPIGCLTSTEGIIPINLTTGTYTLVFDAYQLVGGSPFGIMYSAVLTDTPEPAGFALMGLGLAGIGTMIRRRKRA